MGLLDVLLGRVENISVFPKSSPASPASPGLGEVGGAGDAISERVFISEHIGKPRVPCDRTIPAGSMLRRDSSCAPSPFPALPLGVRIIRYELKSPPVAIDVSSIVVDVEKFIQAELRELDARLHSPAQIRGGWGVFTILDRLRQIGLELEIDAALKEAQTGPAAGPKTSGRDYGTPTGGGVGGKDQ